MYSPPCVWDVLWSAEANTKGEKRAAILQFVLTSVTMERPRKKQTTQMTRRRSLRRWPNWKKAGYMSEIEVVRASRPTNWNTVLQQNVNVLSKIVKAQKICGIFHLYLFLKRHAWYVWQKWECQIRVWPTVITQLANLRSLVLMTWC